MKIYVEVTDDKKQTFAGTIELEKVKKSKSSTTKIQTKSTKSLTATTFVKELYLEKYFENSRTLNNVETKIKSKKHNFDIYSISMALNRSKYLKRHGSRGRYSYIQKTPPK